MAKEMMNFNLPKEESSIIKVIGVGGGGSNAVNHMYKQGIKGVDFVVCNTDQQALDTSPVPKKIVLGSSLTEGRGAGAQAEVGRNAAIENLDDIKEILEGDTKMVFITAGMGGGTGTGAAPIIAEAARELGILTVGIVTIPFGFEGKKRKLQAEKGLEELKKHVDTVLIISNDKLREMYGNLKLSEAFNQADDVLSIAAKGIAEIITVEGYVNVDFEDVRTVMTKSGVAIMGSATTSGEDRATKAVEQALASPLLNDNNIYGASNILLYISSGKDEVTMDEVAEITDYIQEEAGMDADVIWGNGTDLDMDDKLTLTIIATGFSGEKLEKITGAENVIRHTLGSRTPRTTEAQTSIPSGLTTRPVLLNSNPQKPEEPTAELTNTEPVSEKFDSQPIIKHSLLDEPTKETPSLMAFKVDENDTDIKAILDEEAPEMNGVTEREDLPLYNEEEEEEFTELGTAITWNTATTVNTQPETGAFSAEETTQEDTVEETSTPIASEAEKPTLSFQFSKPAEEPVTEETTDDNVITTETSTEVNFELKPEEPTAQPDVKKFDLYDDTPDKAVKSESNELTEEPKLITRINPMNNDGLDTEELHKKQMERMERLKSMNQRFRSPTSLAELENVPAFKRRNVGLNEIPHSSESSVSNFEIKDNDQLDENGNRRGGLSDSNDFLHKSVD